MIRARGAGQISELVVVENFFEELKGASGALSRRLPSLL
jgi:hypothetical protein